MKEEYKDIINNLYKTYSYNSKYDRYCDLYNKISEISTIYESEKEKAERLAIKIAKERNEKINLLLK